MIGFLDDSSKYLRPPTSFLADSKILRGCLTQTGQESDRYRRSLYLSLRASIRLNPERILQESKCSPAWLKLHHAKYLPLCSIESAQSDSPNGNREMDIKLKPLLLTPISWMDCSLDGWFLTYRFLKSLALIPNWLHDPRILFTTMGLFCGPSEIVPRSDRLVGKMWSRSCRLIFVKFQVYAAFLLITRSNNWILSFYISLYVFPSAKSIESIEMLGMVTITRMNWICRNYLSFFQLLLLVFIEFLPLLLEIRKTAELVDILVVADA